jgi:hypothetical protein
VREFPTKVGGAEHVDARAHMSRNARHEAERGLRGLTGPGATLALVSDSLGSPAVAPQVRSPAAARRTIPPHCPDIPA